MLCLYERPGFTLPAKDDRVEHQAHGLNHLALRITDRAAWVARMKEEHLRVGYGGEISWPNSSSWYVNDPTGYEIEVVLWDDDTIRF